MRVEFTLNSKGLHAERKTEKNNVLRFFTKPNTEKTQLTLFEQVWQQNQTSRPNIKPNMNLTKT